jgi:hypothetical protein
MASTVPAWRERAAGWLAVRIVPGILTLLSVGAVVYLAIRSTQKVQPSASEAGLVTLVATVTSLMGSAFFARIGRADPRQARSAVRRLLEIGQPLAKRLERMEPLMAGGTTEALTIESRALAVEVVAALRGLEGSIAEWNAIHEHTLAEVMAEQSEIHGVMAGDE